MEIIPINHRSIELQRRKLRMVRIQRIRRPLPQLRPECLAVQIIDENHPRDNDPDDQDHDQNEKSDTQAGEKPVHE
jgi:hypothetical protein